MTAGRFASVLRHLYRLAGAPGAGALTDRQLLERFAGHRDEAAFAELVRRHGALVWGVCWRVLRHEQDAEDAFQATFLVLAKKAASARWQTSVGNWLYEVAHRLALKARTEAARRRAREQAARETAQPALSPKAAWQQLSAVLDEALEGLPERYRAPLLLCYLEGLTRDQAATQLGWSLGTLKRRLERGRELLHARLARRGLTLSAGLSVALLAPAGAPAGVPPALAAAAVRSGLLFATGRAADGGGTLPGAVALAEGLLAGTAAAKGGTAAALVLTVAILTGGVGLVAYHHLSAGPEQWKSDGNPQPAAREPDPRPPKADRQPDPPPPKPATTTLRQPGTVSCLAFSPDGKTLATGNLDHTVRLWDAATGKELRVLRGHKGAVAGLAFSPDGKLLASAGHDNVIRLWDIGTGKEIRQCLGHRETGRALAFSPDGKRLASGGSLRDRSVCCWDIATGKILFRINGHQREVAALAFSPDGKVLASAGGDPAVPLWDAATGKELRRCVGQPRAPTFQVSCLAFTPDGRTLAAGSLDSRVYLWDAATGGLSGRFQGHRGAVQAVAFTADGQTIASAGADQALRFWDAATGWEVRRDWAPAGMQVSLSRAASGKLLAAGHSGGSVVLWQVTDPSPDVAPGAGP
jgi:RNA polymerase sigma factor (sigma-70 family)